jgi:regulator of sigma E protease
MVTFIIFVIVISVLIFVHEFGHFLFAKRAGMKVEEFGFGFPPRIFGKRIGETLYSINWIPFGGFVKVFGEDGTSRGTKGSFGSKSFPARMKVVTAGVVMNFLFAVFLLMIGNFLGLRIGLLDDADISLAREKKIQIIQVAQDSPAQEADIRMLDEIIGFKMQNGFMNYVYNSDELSEFTRNHAGETTTVIIGRGDELIEKELYLREDFPEGQGPMGVSAILTGVISHNWHTSIWKGVHDGVILTVNTIYGYFFLFKQLIFGGELIGDVSGPIGIATLTGQAAKVGFNYLIQFVALISVNLAILNSIPFPALDGGRAFMLLLEKAKGSPLNEKVERYLNTVGFLVLLALMLWITVRDIAKFL